MRVSCAAVVPDERQRDNLCQCVRILGAVPVVLGETVSVDYSGLFAERVVELFSHYSTNQIQIEGR